jgi:hypothetical protein
MEHFKSDVSLLIGKVLSNILGCFDEAVGRVDIVRIVLIPIIIVFNKDLVEREYVISQFQLQLRSYLDTNLEIFNLLNQLFYV